MAVRIGSARIDERGKATGGAAGDQTGKEVSIQNWYAYASKGYWRVFRANDVQKRELIARDMEKACANNHIGYDQSQRNTLYNACKEYGFDVSKVAKNVETDCSALVRVCCNYAGIKLGDIRTSTEAKALLATGAFTELTDSKYRKKSDYLCRGDILVTAKTPGHTVVVLSNGAKFESGVATSPVKTEGVVTVDGFPTLSEDDTGEYVKILQNALLNYDANCLPIYGADGDFGEETTKAVKAFQSFKGLEVDGVVGKYTWNELYIYMIDSNISITGRSVNIREAAGTDAKIVAHAYEGNVMHYTEAVILNNVTWYHVVNGWISGKYAKVV